MNITQITVNITKQIAGLKCDDKLYHTTQLNKSMLGLCMDKFMCVPLFHYTTTVYLTSAPPYLGGA